MNIHDLMATVEWSHPIQLNTKRGPRLLKKAPITQQFWKVYGEDKELFKKQMSDAGIQLGKFREEWQLTHWSTDDLKFKQIIGNDNPAEAVPELDLIPLLHPEGLLPYQLTSVQMGVASMNKYNRVLLGHSTGVGKTFCAICYHCRRSYQAVGDWSVPRSAPRRERLLPVLITKRVQKNSLRDAVHRRSFSFEAFA